jgi:hypothetical protein
MVSDDFTIASEHLYFSSTFQLNISVSHHLLNSYGIVCHLTCSQAILLPILNRYRVNPDKEEPNEYDKIPTIHIYYRFLIILPLSTGILQKMSR